MSLSDEVEAARVAGLSYGKYVALKYKPTLTPIKKQQLTPPRKKRTRDRKYTDEQLFHLWQQGLTDAEIGAAVGVSRAMIQKWRDNMEIPSVAKQQINPLRYRLVKTQYGPYVVRDDDNI